MSRDVGVRRERAGLAEASAMIDRWCSYVLNRQFANPSGWQLQNMLCVSRLMVRERLSGKRAAAYTCEPTFRGPITSIGVGTFPSADSSVTSGPASEARVRSRATLLVPDPPHVANRRRAATVGMDTGVGGH